MGSTFGFATVGAQKVTTSGIVSSTQVQASFPACTVTVYNHGTITLATIYSDANNTPLANPFTANNNGSWQFYAAGDVHYDVVLSGAGFPAPFTISDITIGGTTRSVAEFAGADLGARIMAAIAALPASGGVLDARSIQGNQTLSAITVSKQNVTILFGIGSFTMSAGNVITANNGLMIRGEGPGLTTLSFTGTVVNGQADVQMISAVGKTNIILENMTVDMAQANRATPATISHACIYFQNCQDVWVRNVECKRSAQEGILVAQDCSRMYFSSVSCHNNNQEGFAVSATPGTGAIPSYIHCTDVDSYDNALVSGNGDQALFCTTKSEWVGGFIGGRTGTGPSSGVVMGSDFPGSYAYNALKGLLVENVNGPGVFLQRCPHTIVEGCTIRACAVAGGNSAGIFATSVGGTNADHLRIANNRVIGSAGLTIDGIQFAGGCANSVVVGNNITGVTRHGVYLSGANNAVVTVVGNHCESNGGDGIRAESGNTTITGNTLNSNTGNGVTLATSSSVDSLVVGNQITNNTGTGINSDNSVTQPDRNHFSGNVLHGNGTAISAVATWGANTTLGINVGYSGWMTSSPTVPGTIVDLVVGATVGWTPGAIASGSSATQSITVTGVSLGFVAVASFSLALPAGCGITAAVTGANTVQATIYNNSGAPQNIGAGTLRVNAWAN